MKKISIGLIGISIVIMLVCASCASGGSGGKPSKQAAHPLDPVIEASFAKLSERLTAKSRVALLPINAADRENGNYAYDTLSMMFVDTMKYDMVERAQMNKILQEQNFQYSGLVDDNKAVSLGKLLGAQVIIIGDISGSGATRRLVFRCLEVETGKILAISQERF